MKTLNLTLLLLGILSITALAQEDPYIKKNTWIAGGNASLTLTDDDKLYFTIDPSVGYFIGDKIMVGTNVNYQNSDNNYQLVSVGVFTRYYFGRNKLAPFSELSFGSGRSRSKYSENGQTTITTNTTTVGHIGVGLDYFIVKNVAIEGVLKYRAVDSFEDENLNFSVGLQLFFARKSRAE